MKKTLLAQLVSLKQDPSLLPNKDWKARTRSFVVDRARVSRTADDDTASLRAVFHIKNFFVPARMYIATRGVFVFLLSFGLVTSGLVATASPLPRDIVFNVKVAVATATGNTQEKAKLHIDEASFQSQQLNDNVKATSDNNEPKKIKKQVKKIKKQVESAGKTLESLKQEDVHQAEMIAKDFSAQTSVISEQLKEVSKEVEAIEGDEDVAKEVVETRNAVKNTAIGAIEVLTNSEDIAGNEDTKSIVTGKIAEIVSDAQDAGVAAQTISDNVEKMSTSTLTVIVPNASTTQSIIVPTSGASVTGTDGMALLPAPGTLIGTQAVTTLKETADKVSGLANDIKQLIEENQLPEALEKAKLLNTLTTVTESAIVEVKKSTDASAMQGINQPTESNTTVTSTSTS